MGYYLIWAIRPLKWVWLFGFAVLNRVYNWSFVQGKKNIWKKANKDRVYSPERSASAFFMVLLSFCFLTLFIHSKT